MRGWVTIGVIGLLSGLGIYWGWGLQPVWLLSWLAPVLLLWLAMRSTLRTSLFAGVLAGAIGYGGSFPYYRSILPLPMTFAVIFGEIVFLCVAIAFVYWQSRRLPKAWHPWLFPLVLTSIELLVRVVSGNGDASSIAFSQGDQPVVLQIASVTGSLGIVFLLALLPAWLAVLFSSAPRRLVSLAAPPIVLILVLFGGYWRLIHTSSHETVPVSLVCMDSRMPRSDDAEGRTRLMRSYATAIAGLPAQTLVVMPERIVNIPQSDLEALDRQFWDLATQFKHPILAGGAVWERDRASNQARLYLPSQPCLVYQKQHLVPGLERAFGPGTKEVVASIGGTRVGVAICRDLFFESPSFQYGRLGVQVLAVPGWDFPPDGWFRARLALVRGVENGMAVARSARQGMLTLSDRYGRIIAERSSDGNGSPVTLTGMLPVEPARQTLYLKGGWLFPWVCLALCLVLVVRSLWQQVRAGKR
jgi:apolipoprotein N-acyltransferase